MEPPIDELVVRRFKQQSVINDRTGEEYITRSNARHVLGRYFHVPRKDHQRVIKGMINAGTIDYVNKRFLRLRP